VRQVQVQLAVLGKFLAGGLACGQQGRREAAQVQQLPARRKGAADAAAQRPKGDLEFREKAQKTADPDPLNFRRESYFQFAREFYFEFRFWREFFFRFQFWRDFSHSTEVDPGPFRGIHLAGEHRV
jgi:hypothetical protein